MRLDHLLSKEPFSTVWLVVLWNIDFCWFAFLDCLVLPFLGVERFRVWWIGFCTLLGFEASDFGFVRSSAHETFCLFCVVWFRPYFENYTVDASIFVDINNKLLSAIGGCLGTKSRRRT